MKTWKDGIFPVRPYIPPQWLPEESRAVPNVARIIELKTVEKMCRINVAIVVAGT